MCSSISSDDSICLTYETSTIVTSRPVADPQGNDISIGNRDFATAFYIHGFSTEQMETYMFSPISCTQGSDLVGEIGESVSCLTAGVHDVSVPVSCIPSRPAELYRHTHRVTIFRVTWSIWATAVTFAPCCKCAKLK